LDFPPLRWAQCLANAVTVQVKQNFTSPVTQLTRSYEWVA